MVLGEIFKKIRKQQAESVQIKNIETAIRKIGNSSYVLLPAIVLKAHNIQDNDKLVVTVKRTKIIINKKHYK